jgi:tetratricopeptide (TPR) repeat protein
MINQKYIFRQIGYPKQENQVAYNWFGNGMACLQKGDNASAIKCFVEAIHIDHGYVQAIDMLAVTLKKEGEISRAIAFYMKSYEILPGTISLMNLGSLLTDCGQYDDANLMYGELIERWPLNPEGYFGRYRVFVAQNKYTDESLSFAQQSYSIYSDIIQLEYMEQMATEIKEQFKMEPNPKYFPIYDLTLKTLLHAETLGKITSSSDEFITGAAMERFSSLEFDQVRAHSILESGNSWREKAISDLSNHSAGFSKMFKQRLLKASILLALTGERPEEIKEQIVGDVANALDATDEDLDVIVKEINESSEKKSA